MDTYAHLAPKTAPRPYVEQVAEKVAAAIVWIQGLLDAGPEVKQGQHGLGDAEYGYCCLGYGCVLNEIAYDHEAAYSSELRDAVGLHTQEGAPRGVGYKEGVASLMSCTAMNDIDCLTFPQIGAILRDNPHAYFDKDVADSLAAHFTA